MREVRAGQIYKWVESLGTGGGPQDKFSVVLVGNILEGTNEPIRRVWFQGTTKEDSISEITANLSEKIIANLDLLLDMDNLKVSKLDSYITRRQRV